MNILAYEDGQTLVTGLRSYANNPNIVFRFRMKMTARRMRAFRCSGGGPGVQTRGVATSNPLAAKGHALGKISSTRVLPLRRPSIESDAPLRRVDSRHNLSAR